MSEVEGKVQQGHPGTWRDRGGSEMEIEESENVERWLAWRRACEHGWDRAEAYDLCLHPDTRLSLDLVLAQVGFDAPGPVSVT